MSTSFLAKLVGVFLLFGFGLAPASGLSEWPTHPDASAGWHRDASPALQQTASAYASGLRPAGQADVPHFEPAACPFPIPAGKTIECGYLVVLEDHARPDGPTIRIAVAIIKSRTANPAPDPIVFLNGGPGGYTLANAALYSAFDFNLMLATRDVIFFDQRGVGFSQPALDCPEVTDAIHQTIQDTTTEQRAVLVTEGYRQCRDHLVSQGVNLAAYTSAQSAADLDDLRSALGHREWNLYGVSYGTRLALTAMRDHPAGIRSVILDSTYPPPVNANTDVVANAEHSFGLLFDGCAADLICNAIYPNLKAVFYDLMERLNAQPVTVRVKRPTTSAPFDVRLTGYELAGAMFNALYSAQGIALLPGVIYDAHEGDYVPLAQRAADSLHLSDASSIGMAVSVQCSEEAPFTTREQILAATAASPAALRAVADRLAGDLALDLDVCQAWVAANPDPIENEPVHSDIPTLVLAGQYDPATSPAWGKLAAASLTRSFYYEFPGVGHGVNQGGTCPIGIKLAFVANPTQTPDASCISRMDARPGFTIRAKTTRLPVWLVLPLLGTVAGWVGWCAGVRMLARRQRPFTFAVSWRLVGWMPSAVSGGLAALFFLFGRSLSTAPFDTVHLVETLVPLIAAAQAAFVFSPDDEPGLEVTMACPRPLAWTILERLAVLIAAQGGVALAASLIAATLAGEALAIALVRWIAPLVFLIAVAVCLTLITRQTIFGAGLVALMWFGMLLVGDSMIARWPFLWPIHIYLQPDHVYYALNRVVVTLVGLNLIVLATTWLLRDEERVLLGGRSAGKRWRGLL